MLIKYYNDEQLSYSARKRYNRFDFVPFNQEEQLSVLLGDGANTNLKTKKSNLCRYITIDETRWFVTSHQYLNGGQVQMFLQRDVIGEFGLSGCYGKVERGYTDSILKNRKELSLNEILKERKKILPDTFTYGNYTTSTHNNELWGIVYFAKPTTLDPVTGEPYPPQIPVNIPSFAPEYVNYPLLDDGEKVFSQSSSYVSERFRVVFKRSFDNRYYDRAFEITLSYNFSGTWTYSVSSVIHSYTEHDKTGFNISIDNLFTNDAQGILLCNKIGEEIAKNTIDTSTNGIVFPEFPDIRFEEVDYTNRTVKDGSDFYYYTSEITNGSSFGSVSNGQFEAYVNSLKGRSFNVVFSGVQYTYILENIEYIATYTEIGMGVIMREPVLSSRIYLYVKTYSRTKLSNEESGNIVLDTTQQLVDEPYTILAFPLFNTTLDGGSFGVFNIQRPTAFMIFNTVIQYLSGENPYLIDAQIFPYCPVLTGVASQINGYPFFKISSNTYTHNCRVQLLPSSDVKKDYITRKYSLISPEQSGSFSFNFYDYITEIEDNAGVNEAFMSLSIKVSLKPFAIITSCVLIPSTNSLKGITYYSDLRGAQPTSNGFECSLSSNAFETYRRQNSNYQQIFNLQKEELAKQHQVEKINEITGAVVNTITGTAMGAMAGAAMADFTVMGNNARGAGAIIGGAAAAITLGTANAIQAVQNEGLRKYERDLQQQRFDLDIGTIKALPNSINRISSFNEILLQDFWYIIEIYECSDFEKQLVDDFIAQYGYGLGVFAFVLNFYKEGWFLRSTLVSSNYPVNLHGIAANELMGGIYYYEQV